MQNEEVKSPVLVTGATGYVAGWLIRELLERGCSVHAAVRDPSREEKLAPLKKLAAELPGEIQFFKSDLLEEGSYREAMQGCKVVFHTASPFALRVKDAQRDLVEPAVVGTRNVLEEANRTDSVERVVLTSSVAAIYGDSADLEDCPREAFNEEDWNTSSSLTHQPYSYSKTMAEKEAWKIAEAQTGWKLVVINPSFVLGPAIDPLASGESLSMMTQVADGSMKAGAPDMNLGAVDVRDVALAHIAAGFLEAAEGRHVTSAENVSMLSIAEMLRESFGDSFPFPKKTLPNWLVWLVGPLTDKAVTRKFVSRNIGYPWRGDNSKARTQLGIQFRPMKETVRDMLQQMIDAGRVKA